jgi:hypothetical protein
MPKFVFHSGLVKTRPYIHLLMGVTVVLLAFGVTVRLLRLGDPISPRAFERLRLGMTELEVENAIGLPPGDHSQGAAYRGRSAWRSRSVGAAAMMTATWKYWGGDSFVISVAFDPQGAAVAYELWGVPAAPRQNLAHDLATAALGLDAFAFLVLLVRLRQPDAR